MKTKSIELKKSESHFSNGAESNSVEDDMNTLKVNENYES